MGGKRYARVVVVAPVADDLKRFLAQRELDLGGRPFQAAKGWCVEFYLPEAECEDLGAPGCEFTIDRSYFDRLHADHLREQARQPTKEQIDELAKKREFPAFPRDAEGRLRRFDR